MTVATWGLRKIGPARVADADTGERLFLASLPTIDAIVSKVCVRHHLRADEREEFSSIVRLAIIERDYAVLRQFDGRGRLAAFLNVVINRLLYDYRCKQWGRWRASAEANRRGPVAILLERLTDRDGLSLDQAFETARANYGVQESVDELYEIHDKLPPVRVRCRNVAESAACDIASREPAPDAGLFNARAATRMHSALGRVMQSLPAEDRLILRMRFYEAWPTSRVAAAVHCSQKRLYVRLDKIIKTIREQLNAKGIAFEDANEYFGSQD